jgi:hypothetical protein
MVEILLEYEKNFLKFSSIDQSKSNDLKKAMIKIQLGQYGLNKYKRKRNKNQSGLKP